VLVNLNDCEIDLIAVKIFDEKLLMERDWDSDFGTERKLVMKLFIENDCDNNLNAEKILFAKLLIERDWVKNLGTERRLLMKFVSVNGWTKFLIASSCLLAESMIFIPINASRESRCENCV
jgi:hypothetical protein